jgi:hypothetical protein
MAYFAKLDENNIVLNVHSVENNVILVDEVESEQKGIEFLQLIHGHPHWKQTSFNTLAGKHSEGKTPFRKNFAAIDYLYDPVKDAFYAPKPYSSWTLDEETCLWISPVPCPADGQEYHWMEDKQVWEPGTTVAKYE